MVKLGNFFFRTRNYLFPLFYIFLFLPLPRISSNYPTLFYAGLAVVLLGQLVRGLTIGLVYIIRGGKNRRIYAEGLVTDGLFGHCRNPMYVGNILLIVGMSILSNSLFAVCIMPVLFIFIYQAIVRAEEAFLEDKFGGGFLAYCGQVNRWWPRFQGMAATFKKHSFDFKNVIIKEYNTTYLWCLGTTLLLAYNTIWFNLRGLAALPARYSLTDRTLPGDTVLQKTGAAARGPRNGCGLRNKWKRNCLRRHRPFAWEFSGRDVVETYPTTILHIRWRWWITPASSGRRKDCPALTLSRSFSLPYFTIRALT